MFTLSKNNKLSEVIKRPILFDANIFMIGLNDRISDKNSSFENMKNCYLIPLFESFTDIYIHEEVYKELDNESKELVDEYINKNKITIVYENGLYGKDPRYTSIFNKIANHELVRYQRGNSKDRGEVYSMAYAAYYNFNYFCSKEIMVDIVADEMKNELNIDIITFDIIILQAFVYYTNKDIKDNNKALKALYKKYCADVIKRHQLPSTLHDYILSIKDYL